MSQRELKFSKETCKEMFTKSDQVFDSNQSGQPTRSATIAAVSAQAEPNQPEVAAVRPPRRPKPQRGAGGNKPTPPANTSKPAAATATPTAHKGPRHATAKGANEKLCKIHYRWGENGSYCAAPWKCPMKDTYKAPQ